MRHLNHNHHEIYIREKDRKWAVRQKLSSFSLLYLQTERGSTILNGRCLFELNDQVSNLTAQRKLLLNFSPEEFFFKFYGDCLKFDFKVAYGSFVCLSLDGCIILKCLWFIASLNLFFWLASVFSVGLALLFSIDLDL